MTDWLAWPFFGTAQRDWAAEVESWAGAHAARLTDEADVDASTRALAAAMGEAGLLRATGAPLSVRHLCIARDILARHSGLADFAFAMQGLGTGPITLFGCAPARDFAAGVRAGRALAAFALSEPEAGSDVAALRTTAVRDGNAHWRLGGEKTWVSNGGIASGYVVFARSGEAPGAKGLTAFWLPAEWVRVVERIHVAAPHPLARIAFDDVRVPDSHRIGAPGEGFKVAMATLDVFRATVGAAALGFARRGLALSTEHARTRHVFGAPLLERQMTQTAIADGATEVDAAALLVYRAAWMKDQGPARVSREASMAKLFATEAAFRIADRCAQLHGGMGVVAHSAPELLTREVRALRVYEGASEIQRIVIARAEAGR